MVDIHVICFIPPFCEFVLFQIMITGLAETCPARKKWTIEQLVEIYGDTIFRISQKSSKKVTMKFKDYVSYMHVQHDEDPLYIFDDKVGIFVFTSLKFDQ